MTTPSTPRLYHTALSPYCRKVRLVLGEKRIEVELVEERWWEPGSEILRRNPAGKIRAVDSIATSAPESGAAKAWTSTPIPVRGNPVSSCALMATVSQPGSTTVVPALDAA